MYKGQDGANGNDSSGNHSNLALERNGFFASDHRESLVGPSHRATFDIHDVGKSRALEGLASLRAPGARAANHIHRIVGVWMDPQR